MIDHGSPASTVRAALSLACVALSCACRGDAERGPDPFAGTPADGPFREIGPAPDGYRPTAAGAPSTDVWVATLERVGDGLRVSGEIDATDRDGYDNQPSFAPDGSSFLYVSAVDSTQTEVMRYDLASGARTRVTHTANASEFSPTSIPGQDAFSAIHEQRGLQHLWRYRADGTELGPIFSTAEPVGYHAWADPRVTAMFILGSPATLQVGDAITGEIHVAAERPGRSIHRIPGTSDISFVSKASDDEWWIERLDPLTGETAHIVRTLAGREDYAWLPEGALLMGDGEALWRWSEAAGWSRVEGLRGTGSISRVAVSPDGRRIAIVRSREGGA